MLKKATIFNLNIDAKIQNNLHYSHFVKFCKKIILYLTAIYKVFQNF